LCAKLSDPAPAGAVCDCGPAAAGTASMSAGHGPLCAARGCSPAAAGAAGMSTGHESLHAAHDCSLAVDVELWWTCGPHSSTNGQR